MPDSPWTETGNSISLAPTTTTIDGGSSPQNVNYLTNSDKIALMAQYAAELAMKTALDSTALNLGVSSTGYDNSVAAISTGLIAAGAPSSWAVIWPDGTTSGPWAGIQTTLSSDWAAIATQRTALQSAISSAQAAAARIAAISASILAAQPHVVSWAYASKPSLPSVSYPAGYYAITTDFRTVQVNAAGTAWVDIFIAANGLFGTLDAGSINVINLNASNIATGTMSAQRVLFSDGSALTTASRVSNSKAQPFETYTSSSSGGVWSAVAGMGFTVTASGATDVFNIFASVIAEGDNNTEYALMVVVDGNTSNALNASQMAPLSNAPFSCAPFFACVTGLSAGSHTLQFYAAPSADASFQIQSSSYAICQHIF
jgi:hypothetical protein